MKYSVFTVCMPEVPMEQVPAKLAAWGYDGVEWRTVDQKPSSDGKPAFWAGNLATLPESQALARAQEVRQLCRQAGIQVLGLASYRRCSDRQAIAPLMEAAAAMGAGHVRIGVPGYDGSENYNRLFKTALADYARVEKLAAKYRVKALIETHMGLICASASATLRFVEHFDPKHVGVIYDPGNMVREGYENYQAGFEILGKYLTYVHVKNAAWRKTKTEEDGTVRWGVAWMPLSKGIVNWHEVLTALRRVGYDGWLSQEDFSPGRSSATKLRRNVAYLKAIEKQVSG